MPEGRFPVPAVRPWRRLWIKLALFGALGVVVIHAVHVMVSGRIASRELARQLVRQGDAMAQIMAKQCANAILADDRIALQELVESVASSPQVAYCFIQQGSSVLASSFSDGTPTQLVRMAAKQPHVVVVKNTSYLDLPAEVAHGSAGRLRIGFRLAVLQPTRTKLAATLGTIAVAVILLSVLAAFAVGRQLAAPVGSMLSALQKLDPSRAPTLLPVGRLDEIGLLGRKVNEMCIRLHTAHLERERAGRRQLQTEKLAALGTLVAGVAHEINNPLAGLKNCQRLLGKEGISDERRREYLELMEEGLTRIERVVGDLLNFARIRTPRRSRERLAAMLESTANLLRPAVERRWIRVEVDLAAAAEISLTVDRGQIEQALLNLLLNAAYVTVASGLIRVSVRAETTRVGIQVRDWGPGIPPEIRGQIEDPFFSTKPEGEGTGLGLSVARTIVDAHHGDLSFEFPDDGGTLATLWLPRGEPAGESQP